VHEWGTFTSIAGPDGMALEWQPFGGPSDLPCFVHRFQIGFKAVLTGTVRMETPVIYFYSPQAIAARVQVAFPKGFITEWYPRATQVARPLGSGSDPQTGNVSRNSGIRSPRDGEPDFVEWPSVNLEPGAAPGFPIEAGASHYYAARSTDSVPLIADGEAERFLFYRGVGRFQPPIAVENLDSSGLRIRNLSQEAQPFAFVFQNDGGTIHYRSLGALSGEVTAEIPTTSADLSGLKADLERALTEQGLFPKESHAMVETWRDSWFEEGSRVFYILPASDIESILPLRIEPKPDKIARVFVGRVEVITPKMRSTIGSAIERGDRETLAKYGRFLQPIARQFPGSAAVQDVFQKYLNVQAHAQIVPEAGASHQSPDRGQHSIVFATELSRCVRLCHSYLPPSRTISVNIGSYLVCRGSLRLPLQAIYYRCRLVAAPNPSVVECEPSLGCFPVAAFTRRNPRVPLLAAHAIGSTNVRVEAASAQNPCR